MRRKLSKLLADTAAAQQRAVQVLGDELERRAAVEIDPDVLAGITFEPVDLEWDPDVLTSLGEPVDLSDLLGELPDLSQSLADIDRAYHEPRPVFIPIGDDPPAKPARTRQRRQRSR